MKKILFVMMLLNTPVSAATLAPSDVRAKSYVEPTTIKADQAYARMAEWFAKTFHNSNSAIKLQDPKLHKIVAKGNISCKALGLGNGFASEQRLEFTVTAESKDKRVRISFEELIGKADGAYDSGDRPSNKEETDKAITECIEPIRKSFVDGLAAKPAAKDNW